MDRRRLLLIGIVALLVGAFTSFAVYRSLQKRIVQPPPGVAVVVAARDLVQGQALGENDLRVVNYPADFLPIDALHSTVTAVKRSVLLPVGKGHFVTTGNLAMEGDKDRLEHLIPPGMRAAAVSVNDVTSVAGFTRPGSLVDVLVTGPTPDQKGLRSMTVLQRVRVLATGTQMEGNPTKEARDARVVTLLVTPEEAEKLAFAMQEGRVQLVIRNPLDGSQETRPPVDSLEGTRSSKRTVRVKYVPAPAPAECEITVIRGERTDCVKNKN